MTVKLIHNYNYYNYFKKINSNYYRLKINSNVNNSTSRSIHVCTNLKIN